MKGTSVTTRSLVPATLMWLRVYRKEQPDLFECRPSLSDTIRIKP